MIPESRSSTPAPGDDGTFFGVDNQGPAPQGPGSVLGSTNGGGAAPNSFFGVTNGGGTQPAAPNSFFGITNGGGAAPAAPNSFFGLANGAGVSNRLNDLPLPLDAVEESPIVAQSFMAWGIVPAIVDRAPRQLANVVFADKSPVILGEFPVRFSNARTPFQATNCGRSRRGVRRRKSRGRACRRARCTRSPW